MRTDFGSGVGAAVAVGTKQLVPPASSSQRARMYFGFSAAEATGLAGAEFRLHDGADATGSLLAVVTLTSNESVPGLFIPYGGEVLTSGRIALEVVSGQVRGCVYWG